MSRVGLYVPDFELGEDIRNDVRKEQDNAWASAVADGRGHISHREAAATFGGRLNDSIQSFLIIEALVDSMLILNNKISVSLLQSIDQYVLLMIVEFLLPQYGLLVLEAVKRRSILFTTHPLYAIHGADSDMAVAFKAAADSKILADNAATEKVAVDNARSFRLCVRKRPILRFEKVCLRSNTEHDDGITYIPYDACCATLEPKGTCLSLHDGKLARNGRRLSMQHHTVFADHVYSEHSGNQEFCLNELLPLLGHVSSGNSTSSSSCGVSGSNRSEAKRATMICFGQTGTGKTYTMQACLHYLARFLMGGVVQSDAEMTIAQRYAGCQVHMKFYEVHGKKCYDLLNNRKEVKLLADSNDVMCLRGAKVLKFDSSNTSDDAAETKEADMLDCLASALKLRSAEVTERNPVSSRSHAVCDLSIKFCDETFHKKQENESGICCEKKGESEDTSADTEAAMWGVMRLVDLAGSERNYETLKMSAKEHMESADINTSLMALKDCFRTSAENARVVDEKPQDGKKKRGNSDNDVRLERAIRVPSDTPRVKTIPATAAASKHVPFRAHLLTRVLKDSFVSPASQSLTTVIATVSPSPIDLIHSLNTLEHAVLMSPKWEKLKSSVTVDVSLYDSMQTKEPMEKWSAYQVGIWLATCDNGRFSMLQVPKGLDGKGLCGLNTSSLGALFEGTLRQARMDGEGDAWIVGLDVNGEAPAVTTLDHDDDDGIDLGFLSMDETADGVSSTNGSASITRTPNGTVFTDTIARQLWSTIRREQRAIAYRLKTNVNQLKKKE